jgi:hypothetical protein
VSAHAATTTPFNRRSSPAAEREQTKLIVRGAVPVEAIRVTPRLSTIKERLFREDLLIIERGRENSFAGLLATWVGWPQLSVPHLSHKKVQTGHEKAKSAKDAMAKTLGKMLKR